MKSKIMKKFIFFVLICYMTCNSALAQSLGKMTLGCTKAEIQSSLPSGFNFCKTNTSSQVTYSTTNDGSGYSEYVSFYLKDNIVYKILMHKWGLAFNEHSVNSRLEDVFVSLCETWGEPSYVGENIYWNFSTSKATFSYTVSKEQFYGVHGIETQYIYHIDIKLEKRTSLFE